MGEEVRITDYDVNGGGGGVSEWEDGLPNGDDLTPLSQMLISSELLSAFNITPEPYRSVIDVNRASQNTLADLGGESELGQPSLTKFNSTRSFTHVDESETTDLPPGGSGCRKLQRIDGDGDGDGGGTVEETETDLQADDPSARVMKRQRLVWTPQLHKRFIEVVAHLGVKNAVPKTIMQLMNVEGLTRENVASHLQKYRLYLKRMQGSPQGASASDHLFSSTPVPQNLPENGYHPMPYGAQMVHQMQYPVPNSDFRSNSYMHNAAGEKRNWSGNGFDSGYHRLSIAHTTDVRQVSYLAMVSVCNNTPSSRANVLVGHDHVGHVWLTPGHHSVGHNFESGSDTIVTNQMEELNSKD